MGSPHSLIDPETANLVLFDGVCNLCNGAVQFIIKHDRANRFRFASLQSETAKKYIAHFSVTGPELYSLLLIKNGKVYDRSAAVLEIAKHLSGLWPVLAIFIILPEFFRDGIYSLIARNRYRLFGKKDQCMIPTPDLTARFLQ